MNLWCVILTKPRQECVAQINLERQGFECFLPLMNEWRKRRGRKWLAETAMFPNYIFTNINLSTTSCAPIRSTRGVNSMVRFGNEIVPVPDQVIESIKQFSRQQLLKSDVCQYKLGQQVHIESGPFVGLSAIFLEQSGTERALLLLDMLGQQQRIELPMAALK